MISRYYIKDYPKNYNPKNLPHENSLDGAKNYCLKHNCSGVTFENNRYEVRDGKYIDFNDTNIVTTLNCPLHPFFCNKR